MNDDIPNLKIERMEDGIGQGLILLEQDDNSGNIASVAIHPIHLRYMAEKFGLVETGDPHARKTVATLTRRLFLLRDRIDHLGDYLTNNSDHAHANLDYELTYITATAALADEFCAELDEPAASVDSSGPASAAPPAVVPDGVVAQSSQI
ncbi:MAG: hypothetical protein KA164_18715 [Rhodoferax sp.]|nr:hypothetical protein [Rhodoferax sp.]